MLKCVTMKKGKTECKDKYCKRFKVSKIKNLQTYLLEGFLFL